MKRIISLLLVLVLVVALVGCGKKKKQPIKLTLGSEDSAKILAAAGIKLPDISEAKGANSVIRWFSWYDFFQNYNEDEIVNTGYFTFTDFYGGSIDYWETTYADFSNDLAQHVLADDIPDFVPTGISQIAVFPMPCLTGTYQPIDQYIDYDNDPLWKDMKDASEYFALGDKHFAIVYDMTFKDVCPYNKRVIENYGYEDPYELYQNDEWTWDKVIDMALDFSDPDSDRYAFDGWYVPQCIVEESTGHYIICKDDSGYYSNIEDPVIEKAQNMVYELVKAETFYTEGTNYWANRNDAQYGAGVKDGLCLFWMCSLDDGNFVMPPDEMETIWGDMSANEVMFVPLPRHSDGDGIYYLSANPTGFMMVKDCPNPDGVALFSNCMRFKTIDPTVVDIDAKQLREKYLWNQDMLDMKEHCEQLVYENIRIFNLGALPENLLNAYHRCDWDIRRTGAATTWAQIKEAVKDQMTYYCDELNADIEKYIETGEPIS